MPDRASGGDRPASPDGSVEVVRRADLARCPRWAVAFAGEHKDHRYYELVEDTIMPEFDYRYFVIRDGRGEVFAVQPFFLLDQDLLAGTGARIGALASFIRRLLPRFMLTRTLMVGCAAGGGHLDAAEEPARSLAARLLASHIREHARRLGARLIVLKEFPATDRPALRCFLEAGFTRIPSLPMTSLGIAYAGFDDYLARALSKKTRQDVRKKLRAAAKAPPIELTVVNDIVPFIDDVYPLYLQVYGRSKLHFDKLTKSYFSELGRRMPDRARFFIWRQSGRTVAFSICLIHDDAIYAEYLGLDYTVALDLHLYHYAFRDVVSWAIDHGCKRFRSGGLNYDPKLHLRHVLDPVDLYVRHTSSIANALLGRLLPFMEPTRQDKTLKKFANYHELWDEPGPRSPTMPP
jgi:hypothetical protein